MRVFDALVDRIGLERLPRADVAGLFALHRAFLTRIPYEAISVQLGESGSLDLAPLVERLGADGRGGYCFELNTVLAALLRECGFAVSHHQAVVGDGPTNHMALVVEAEGSRWLADAGLGEGFLEPLPLRAGTHAVGPLSWTLARTAGGWWLGQHEWGSIGGFAMAAEPSPVAAFEPHHARLSTSPESSFVQTLVVQRPQADHVVTLRARTLTERGPSIDTRRILTSPDDLENTLLQTFGITLRGERLTRLWSLAATQHEAFVGETGMGAFAQPCTAPAATASGQPRAPHGATAAGQPRAPHGATAAGQPRASHGATAAGQSRASHGATAAGQSRASHGATASGQSRASHGATASRPSAARGSVA